MTRHSVELEIQLAAEKDQLRTSLARLSDRASETLDWRRQFRRHPVEMLGAAILAGAVVGAMTARGRGSSSDVGESRRPRESAGAPNAAWDRLKMGITGMLADRALIATQDLVERFVEAPIRRGVRDRTKVSGRMKDEAREL